MSNLNECGMIAPLFEEPIFMSKRNTPLVTQYISDCTDTLVPHLTVENYEKWYEGYIINVDGTVRPLLYDEWVNPDIWSPWHDHAINPDSFHKTAIALGAVYDNRTFALVCERWVEDVLDDDWTKLAKFLPR